MAIATITRMVVKKGREAEFEELWKARFMSNVGKGSLGYKLLRSVSDPSVYIQIGFWTTREARQKHHNKFGNMASVKSQDGGGLFDNSLETDLFEVVAEKERGVFKFYGCATKKADWLLLIRPTVLSQVMKPKE